MVPFAESRYLQPHHPTRGSQQELRLLLILERSDDLFFSFEGSIHSQLPEPRLSTGDKQRFPRSCPLQAPTSEQVSRMSTLGIFIRAAPKTRPRASGVTNHLKRLQELETSPISPSHPTSSMFVRRAVTITRSTIRRPAMLARCLG